MQRKVVVIFMLDNEEGIFLFGVLSLLWRLQSTGELVRVQGFSEIYLANTYDSV
jgi:hypothetical protein